MLLRQIHDPQLSQYSYLIGCQATGNALIIDPERDIDRYKHLAEENSLEITAVTETHIHADFVSGAREFAQNPSITLYLSGEGGEEWSYKWPGNRPNTHFLKAGDSFMVGKIRLDIILTPGHTPEHICFLITDLGGGASSPIALISGDFLFVGNVGRPDLLESAVGKSGVKEESAHILCNSLNECLQKYEDYLQILPAHGAGSACGKGIGALPMSTLGYERRFNSAFKLALSDKAAFIKDILAEQPDPPLYFATMKRLNRDGAPVTGGPPQPLRLDANAFAKAAKEHSIKILDTRDNLNEFDDSHFPGSISAPLHASLFSNSAGSFLNENDPILLIIEKPEDIDLAVIQLYRIGFDKIKNWITVKDLMEAGLLNESTQFVAASTFDPEKALKDGCIIDVRNTSEYQQRHLSGALSIPYTRIKEHLKEIPKNTKSYIHCASGRRATVATSFLRAANYDAVLIKGSLPQLSPQGKS